MFGKKVLVTGLCLVMAAGVLTAGCGSKDTKPKADAGKTMNFRLAESHPTDYPTTQGDRKFAELVKERTNGRINIKVFDSSQLGEEKAVIEQVQLGSIDFTRVSSSPLGEFNKSMSVFSLPYIFDNSAHMWKFLNGDFAQKMLDNLQSSKFVGLSYMDGGARSFYTKNPVKGPADLKGMKIRVMQSKMNMDLMEALGASATPMPYGEVFSALQTGVIDGAENNAPSFLTANHFQAVKNYTLDAHQRIPEVLMASKTTWDKISPEDQKIIKQAAKDATEFQKEAWAKFEKEALDKVIAGGAVVTPVNDAKPWQEAVKSVIEKYRSEFKAELDAIDQARK